jgi:putative restriction endonuclease
MAMKLKDAFAAHLRSTNVEGSGKASSYLRALDLLSDMLRKVPMGFEDCRDIWSVVSVERLRDLHVLVVAEQKKGDKSVWNLPGLPPSYLQNGYCAAALNSYQRFLVEYGHEQALLDVFDTFQGDEAELPAKLDRDLVYPEYLLEDLDSMEGRDVLRSVPVRVNQNVFRRIILKIYRQRCCITGLEVPEINRASHIVGWAKDKRLRMDPRNGLCLSATYDAAFDRGLLSLDDDYRIILSRDLKEVYTSQAVKEYFLKKEGQTIDLPQRYLPNKAYLAKHRERWKGFF